MINTVGVKQSVLYCTLLDVEMVLWIICRSVPPSGNLCVRKGGAAHLERYCSLSLSLSLSAVKAWCLSLSGRATLCVLHAAGGRELRERQPAERSQWITSPAPAERADDTRLLGHKPLLRAGELPESADVGVLRGRNPAGLSLPPKKTHLEYSV